MRTNQHLDEQYRRASITVPPTKNRVGVEYDICWVISESPQYVSFVWLCDGKEELVTLNRTTCVVQHME